MKISDFTNAVMNPTRQRILQYFILHKTATVNDLSAHLTDIPRASLYRHIKTLIEANCIEITKEKAIRGTVERTYSLCANPAEASSENLPMVIQNSLISIASNFADYFDNKDNNPVADMLSVASITLMLSDDEFKEFFIKLGNLYNEYIENKPSADRKPRSITFISSPTAINSKENN